MWIVIGIIVILGCLAFWYRPATLKRAGPQSINTLQQVELGGQKQWISIRGTDVNNPVLLFLHGGPGSANIAKLRFQCPELEEHFVVVNWDQRNAGKSYSPLFQKQTLTLDQLRQDTHQLVLYLRERFGGRKIYLLGFSWGTVLGLWTAYDYPEDIQAYISVAQVVSYPQAEKISLVHVQQVASDLNDTVAIKELAGIDPAYQNEDWYSQLMIERKWLLKYGGVYHTADSYMHELWMMLKAPEYSFVNVALWPLSSNQAMQTMLPELMSLDFFEKVHEIEVPVYFLVGRYDYNEPFELTQSFYEQIQAPQGKQLIWFEDSAHDLFFDQPEKVVEELVKIKGNHRDRKCS